MEEQDGRHQEEGEEQEEEQEETYIPGLTQAALFQELPPLRGFEGLVSKDLEDRIHQEQIYQHNHQSNDLSSASAFQLIQSCSWRALANFSSLKIIHSDPSHTKSILQLWAYRFRALYELQLPNLIQREMMELFGTISKTILLNEILLNLQDTTKTDDSINDENQKEGPKRVKAIPDLVPFSILILRARLPILLRSHINNHNIRDLNVHHHHLDSVIKTSNGLFELLEGCQRMIRYYQNTKFSLKKRLWSSRVEEVVRLLSNLFSGDGGGEYERIQEQTQNINHTGGGVILGFIPDPRLSIDLLKSLKEKKEKQLNWIEEEEIKARMQIGDFNAIDDVLNQLDDQPQFQHIRLFRLMADRQFDLAVQRFLPIVQSRINQLQSLNDLCLVNDLSIALLYSGKLNQGFEMMKKLFEQITGSINNDLIPTENVEKNDENKEQISNPTPPQVLRNQEGEKINEQHHEEDGLNLLLSNRKNKSMTHVINALIFNYSTFIELNFGSNSDQFKLEFFNQLLLNSSSFNPFSHRNNQHSHASIDRLSLLDLINFHSLKLPASYFQP